MSKSFVQLLREKGIQREPVVRKWKNYQEYLEFLQKRALSDPTLQTALKRAGESFMKNYLRNTKRYPWMFDLAKEVKKIKDESIERLDELVKIACDNFKENHAECYVAKDAAEARKIIGEIVGSGKTIVKAKSLTTEEIAIREYLEELGNDVYETDLGEFLVQALGPKPMHFTSPALHLTREKVAEFLEKFFGVKVDRNDIAGMVALVRKFLRNKYFEADIGMSGANVVAADPGALFILTNEGNAKLATAAPPVHIAVVGIEKIVPTFLDAMKVTEVITKFAGYKALSYVNIVSGPSKTGDIEKTITYGAHGPRELHVVFIDNGRSKAAKDPLFKQALRCLKCGACHFNCPVFKIYGGFWG
ncbi:MAG: lactate utilization protein, partial [Thermoprotei archaeon]